MSLAVVLVTGLLAGVVAGALARWMRTLVDSESRWLRSGAQVLVAAVLGAGGAVLASGWSELVAYAALAVACGLLVVLDLAAHRLPDRVVGPMYPVLFGALTVASAVDGSWGRLARAGVAAAALVLCYLLLALAVPSGLGLGDVKLAGLLGAFLGWQGWAEVFVGTLAAFILNGLAVVLLLIARRTTRHSEVAFGPWMVLGAAVGAAGSLG